MITTLQNEDKELDYIHISKYDIVNSLTLNDIKEFLQSLGVSSIIVNEERGYIICPTICHNPLSEAGSMKLYWYHDHKIFRCYTECNEAMSIFELYQKFINVNEGRQASDLEAEDYVYKCIKHEVLPVDREYSFYEEDLNKYQFDTNIPELPEYSKNILRYFTHYYHPLWLRDGITKEAMDKFKISFSIGQNKIIIPHFDINGRLIGIRARTLDPKEAEEFGKYRPIQIGDTLYNHQLQFNLYGIYEHKEAIKKRRSAIIVEGEKSVLLDDGYYGDFSNTVACCGSHFNKYQISMLTDILGANEIVVALDKEYEDWRDDKAVAYRKKIEDMCNRYKAHAIFSYIWDYKNLLKEKDSPFDRGQKIFEELYKNRIRVR